MSKASELAAAVFARVSSITIANGYSTDIGLKVYRGKKTADAVEAPLAFIVEGDDDALDQKGIEARVKIQYAIEGHTACDPENPNDAVHAIVADLKRAIFGGDRTYGGIVRGNNGGNSIEYKGRVVGEREEGASIVGAAILVSFEIMENLANP